MGGIQKFWLLKKRWGENSFSEDGDGMMMRDAKKFRAAPWPGEE